MQTRPLGKTGLEVSIMGYGGSPLGGVFGDVTQAECTRAVHAALDSGINLFDTSPLYGKTRSETALGIALNGVPRESYILSTKLGRYDFNEFDFSAARVTRSIEESLRRLQIEVIDVITCHDIEFVSIPQVIEEAIPALHKAREQGKVRFIGVSGLPLKIYHEVLDRIPLDTILSYCHNTLFDTSLIDHLPYLESKQVGVISASPFAMGLLTGGSLPEWHPAPEAIRSLCLRAFEFCRSRGASLPRLALQFALQEPRIATTLVGMANTAEVEQNVRWMNESLDTDLLQEVRVMLEPIKNQTWPSGRPENNG